VDVAVASPLVVHDLAKSFGALTAVDGVSLEIRAGEVHSLIGPNGAGKTTAFNCICGFLRPTAGRVLLHGRDVTGWRPHRLVAAGLARTFQVTQVFGELTVLENVALAVRSRLGRNLQMWPRGQTAAQAYAEVYEVLDMLGLADRADLNADHLAHGDKRVLEIAIALAARPHVLLMDEPTAGMSPGETERIGELIRRLAQRSAVLLVEHDMEIVLGISDRITVMTQGRVIANGTPDAVSRDPLVRNAYLGAVDAGTLSCSS
jgi:branched-chain amino acid transport system ATP-binding protein